jgi:para-nitrobenzyl esterase
MPQSAPITETSYGKLQGTLEDGILVFRGIPFAKPPLGPLRFRAPERAEPWSGVRDAVRFGPGAHQANRPLAPVLGIVIPEQSEDCLTLNVWTPACDGGRRPVMVFVHGGAGVIGSGSERSYDGSSLARRGDVVVVTINYRLGPFGFLRGEGIGGLGGSGNEGILDVVAALEWVRDEIAAFGGDPANVTAFGESAGSVNIACMLTMPRARGLFHKAVLQSGSLNFLRTPEQALEITHAFLKQLEIAPERAATLRDLPAAGLVAAQNSLGARSMLPPFSPIADGDIIPTRAFAAIASGSARGIPLIVGTNLEEMKLYRFLDPAIDSLDESALAARCSMFFPDGARVAEVYRKARAARGDDASPVETWFAFSTDQAFRAPALKLAELHASHTPDVFVYEFCWRGTTPGKPQGAIHSLELPFVFGTLDVSEIGAIAGRTPAAHELSVAMQDAWLTFARTGRPQGSSLPEWPRYAPPKRRTLTLGTRSIVVDTPREAERALWDPLLG